MPASVAPTSIGEAPPPPPLFDQLVERARQLAATPSTSASPVHELPAVLRDMTYDQYRSIRFRPERSLWRNENAFFEVQLFHLGFYYREPVMVSVVEGSAVEPLAFSPSYFTYDATPVPPADATLGFAGLRVHAPINNPEYRDEVIAFQGASYFRALGRDEVYGLSARALAIDTGEPTPEEFPRFSELYLVHPSPDDRSIWVLAMLESRRASGAYAFRITPGRSTVIDVTARILLREPVAVLGLAPLTSMYLFGEDDPARFDDFRPEVHDSDSLALWSGAGEKLVRPLRNPQRTTVCTFKLDSPRGFGLLQRDRDFDSYQDLEARYESRPSAWVEPIGDWGPGAVRLLEIATQREIDDNIAAVWVPDQVPPDGLTLRYRLYLGPDNPFAGEAARVVATRSAKIENGERFLVDFTGPRVQSADGVEVIADVTGAKLTQGRIETNPHTGGLRAVIDVTPEPGVKDVELRAFLRRGDEALTETWSYLWQPPS